MENNVTNALYRFAFCTRSGGALRIKIYLKKGINGDKTSKNSDIDQTVDLDFDYLYWLENFGLVMLWIAAILTLITGFEYFKKTIPVLREGK